MIARTFARPPIVLLLVAVAAGSASSQGFTVTKLGTTAGGASMTSVGVGAINKNGWIAGTGSNSHALLYKGPGQLLDLGTLPGASNSYAVAVNDSGLVLGSSGNHAVLFGGTTTDLGTLGGNSSLPGGLNNQGQVVGTSTRTTATNAPQHAFLYSAGTMQDLGFAPGGSFSNGNAINDSGLIAGTADFGATGANVPRAFLYNPSNTTWTDLGGIPTATDNEAFAINAAGQVVGYSGDVNNDGEDHAVLWSSGQVIQLGDLGGHSSEAWALNSFAQVVGSSAPTGGGADHAFRWDTTHGIRDLNSLIPEGSGLTLQTAQGINDAGQIAANGPQNQGTGSVACLLTPIHPHVLWKYSDGSISLWDITHPGQIAYHNYGPYAGWTARAVSVGPADGLVRILWTQDSGAISLWTVNLNGTFSYDDYGPYPGWNAIQVVVGTDNQPRLLWNGPGGQISLWTITSAGHFTYQDFGPFAGWSVQSMAVGADNLLRVMWGNQDGRISLWNFNSTGGFATDDYGPFAGWNAQAMAVGGDNRTRIMWVRSTDHTVSLWTIKAPQTFTYDNYGPFQGWQPGLLAVGYDDDPRILWINQASSRVSLWDITSPGKFVYEDYGPFPGWSPAALTAGVE